VTATVSEDVKSYMLTIYIRSYEDPIF